ncbi:hypothetical protein [Jiangella muralis]|nr:hypothetical protein [Jiangella muralis]
MAATSGVQAFAVGRSGPAEEYQAELAGRRANAPRSSTADCCGERRRA